MQRDWFMYHLISTYENRLEYPFNHLTTFTLLTSKIWEHIILLQEKFSGIVVFTVFHVSVYEFFSKEGSDLGQNLGDMC